MWGRVGYSPHRVGLWARAIHRIGWKCDTLGGGACECQGVGVVCAIRQAQGLPLPKGLIVEYSATIKQTEFIVRLCAERGIAVSVDFGTLTKSAASAEISRLLALPRITKSAEVSVAGVNSVGVFRNAEGVFFRVVKSRESGKLYAKKFDGRKFVYAQGAIAGLSESDRLTVEDAAAFGFEFGVCVWCGAELSDPESVARGIGPVCYRNGAWR